MQASQRLALLAAQKTVTNRRLRSPNWQHDAIGRHYSETQTYVRFRGCRWHPRSARLRPGGAFLICSRTACDSHRCFFSKQGKPFPCKIMCHPLRLSRPLRRCARILSWRRLPVPSASRECDLSKQPRSSSAPASSKSHTSVTNVARRPRGRLNGPRTGSVRARLDCHHGNSATCSRPAVSG
jgi:hypothetical protein